MAAPAPDGPVLSVLVVSYNTREMTLACLSSLAAETPDLAHEVIVLDNASADGSADAVAAAHPDVRLIRLSENIGFARGNNRAASEARGRYLLLLNPDTVVLERAVERLVAFAERRPQALIWGGRTLFGDGTLNPTACYLAPSLWSTLCFALGLGRIAPRSALLNPEFIGLRRDGEEMEVDIVTGCLLLIGRTTWERLGGFDPRFFMYAEETDLCLRARVLGARPAVTPEATIIHHDGGSETVRADKIVRGLTAKLTLVAKHWGPGRRVAARALYRLAVLVRWVGYAASARLRGREDHARAAAEWREVWRRRADWLPGWPPVG